MSIHDLIDRLSAQEARLQQTLFIAPCVRGVRVRTRIGGLMYTFRPVPAGAEGWGVFQPVNANEAAWVAAACIAQVDSYLSVFPEARWLLVRPLRDASWLAVPAHASEVEQRFGTARPVIVHLVQHGTAFTQVIARWDSASWWCERVDPRADPRVAEALRNALHAETLPERLRCKGLTPEHRTAYAIALAPSATACARRQQRNDARRLREALATGGGTLDAFQDAGRAWRITWRTSNGERHSSIIAKNDLTVVSAGICLDGCDEDFDLASLVAVVEQRPDWG